MIQPFPYFSTSIIENAGWGLRKTYDDYLGAHRHVSAEKNQALRDLARDIDATLLAYPDGVDTVACFTPRDLMRDVDSVHPTNAYSAIVLSQILQELR